MPEIKRTLAAEEDLLQIWLYIARDNTAAADHFLETVDEKAQVLASQTEMGSARSDLGSHVRSFPVGAYVIFYRPIENGIEVLRVIHGSRGIPVVFRERRQ